jgi:DNA polymerase-1
MEAAGSARRFLPRASAAPPIGVQEVKDLAGVHGLLDIARQRSIAQIGVACAGRYSWPAVPLKPPRLWNDPRSLVPLLMGLALVEQPLDGPSSVHRFAVDLRQPAVREALAELFGLPILFVAHGSRMFLGSLWQLGGPAPTRLWDSWVAERAFCLGRHHPQYAGRRTEEVGVQAWRRRQAEEAIDHVCSLDSACSRYQIAFGFSGAADRWERSFANHPDAAGFTQDQCEYVAATAEAAARLYPLQVSQAVAQGCLDHLINVEMPWTITNARMIWDGVRVDSARCEQLRAACQRHSDTLTAQLGELGLADGHGPLRLQEFFGRLGLLGLFRDGDGYSFADDRLKALEDRHASIPLLRALRKVEHLAADPLLSGLLVGADGRLHPDHRQLGTETGRNTMRDPNIGGVGRALRPLVVPDPGMALGEADWSQFEVGIAAAVYGDADLVRLFNGHDVYCAMAKRYFADRLPDSAQSLPDQVFKRRYRSLRERMKLFTLAVIYNITPQGLAAYLNTPVAQAEREQQRFLGLFPTLAQGLAQAGVDGALRGYATICTGLRRWRARRGPPTPWEVNWLRNTPVQGSAAVVFKVAGNRLRQRYAHYGARLVLPLHDAYLFEAPRDQLSAVAKLTAEVMRSVVQEYFPQLDSQVELNIDHPDCWNKDGKRRSLRLWMLHPELARHYLQS